MDAPEEVGPGTLKCVIGHSPRRALGAVLASALAAHVRGADVRALTAEALLAFTERTAAELRDALAASLEDGESVFVGEFERWSSHGPAADARWLARRGH